MIPFIGYSFLERLRTVQCIFRGYRVEKMDLEKGRWEPIKTTRKPELDVPKLLEGHKYKFRVIAESPNGDSEPLELEDPITAKDPFGKFQPVKI